MALEVIGKLIEKHPTMQISERFKKREFVLDITEEVNGNAYPNFAKMQAVQNRCEILDNFSEGDMVKVSFNIRGNKWEKDGKVNYITSLDAWRIERANAGDNNAYQAPQQQAPQQFQAAPPQNNNFNSGSNSTNTTVDDLPF
jgi:single-stranded DNA-binding protein